MSFFRNLAHIGVLPIGVPIIILSTGGRTSCSPREPCGHRSSSSSAGRQFRGSLVQIVDHSVSKSFSNLAASFMLTCMQAETALFASRGRGANKSYGPWPSWAVWFLVLWINGRKCFSERFPRINDMLLKLRILGLAVSVLLVAVFMCTPILWAV